MRIVENDVIRYSSVYFRVRAGIIVVSERFYERTQVEVTAAALRSVLSIGQNVSSCSSVSIYLGYNTG